MIVQYRKADHDAGASYCGVMIAGVQKTKEGNRYEKRKPYPDRQWNDKKRKHQVSRR